MDPLVTRAAIEEAAARIAGEIHRTPVLSSRTLSERAGCELLFKCENLQRVGAFKFRGALNAVLSLNEEQAARGVATHSSGNHAQALALAAQIRGITAQVVMPEGSSTAKAAAVRGYGAEIVWCEPQLEAREAKLAEIVSESGATFIHPYDDARVIAGAGTAARELLEDHPDIDAVIAPVGGGGLLAGTTVAATARARPKRVFAAEPTGADDAYQSLIAGRLLPVRDPDTLADGLRTSLGELPYSIIKDRVEEIVRVNDEESVAAMRLVWERMKIIIEPSSAVPVAAMLERKLPISGIKVGVILSGGNVDLDQRFW